MNRQNHFEPFRMTFSSEQKAHAIYLDQESGLSECLERLSLDCARPTLLLIGGAGKMTQSELRRLRPLFADVLARAADELGLCVIDGGTDAGVMQLMGQARKDAHASFSLLGVVARGTAVLPNADPPSKDSAPLEPNHTHFILVPGNNWGDEAPWLSKFADRLAGNKPSLTVLVNGGDNSRRDLTFSLNAGRKILVIAGSGRLADELASDSERSQGISILEMSEGLEKISATLYALFEEGTHG
ncbi:MAG: hypothetical protein ACE5IR_20455 [bacterium]